MNRFNWTDEAFGKSYVDGQFISSFEALSRGMDGGAMRGGLANETAGMRGWNWTAVHLKAMQFSTAETDVFVSQHLKSEFEKVYGVTEKSGNGSVQSAQSEGIPDGYEIAPSLYGMQKLLRKPNRWTPGRVWQYQLGQHLEIFGAAFILVLPGTNNVPTEMYLIPKPLMTFWPYYNQALSGGWRVGQLVSGGFVNYSKEPARTFRAMLTKIQNKIFPAEWVIEIGVPHPFFIDDWASPSDAMSDTLQTDLDLNRTRRSVLKNQMTLGPRLSLKPGTVLDANQKEAYLAEMQSRNAGPENAGRASFDPDGISVETAQYNAKEMEYRASIVDSRDAILAQRFVSPSMIGLGDASSYAAVVANSRIFSRYALQPIMNIVSDQLCVGLQTWFQPPYDEFSIRMMASTIDDPQLKETQIANDLKSFALKKGEYRKMRQLEPFGDDRDDEIAGNPSAPAGAPGMPGAPGEASGASATGVGSAMNPSDVGAVDGPAAIAETKSATEYSAISRQQFVRNRKAIADILSDVRDGEMAHGVGVEMLAAIGVESDRAQRMLDATMKGRETSPGDSGTKMVLKGVQAMNMASGVTVTAKNWFGAKLTGKSRRAVMRATATLLSEGCRESGQDPHVKVLYPIGECSPQDIARVRNVASGIGPAGCHFGRVYMLGDSDDAAIVVEVISEELKMFHKAVSQILPSSSRHITYRPHVTMAYVPDSYTGEDFISGLNLENVSFSLRSFRIEGDRTSIIRTAAESPSLSTVSQKTIFDCE